MRRIAALLSKDLAELRRSPGVFVAAGIAGAAILFMPFAIAVIVPALFDERLSDSSDFEIAVEMYKTEPVVRDLDPESAIQAWIFQSFLAMLLLTPVAGAMSIAAFSVVGEKQARSLEPLLATPITTFELLAAKVLSALLPAMALGTVYFAVYVALAAAFARPGVFWILLTPRSLVIVFVLGSLAALAALQLAVCASSRANDARSAQQIGALIVLPCAGLFGSQIAGAMVLTPWVIGVIVFGLLTVNAVLMVVAIKLFDRESILTRWK